MDNGEITFLHRFPIEKHSSIKKLNGLQSVANSLILAPEGPISSAEAITRFNNYFDKHVAPFSEQVEADTRFVYYENGEFETYLSYLSTQALEHKIAITGLNIVFSVYDDHCTEGLYANHLNLFFVPTREHQGKQQAFAYFSTGEDEFLDLKSPTLAAVEKELFSAIFNRAHGVPPPHNWD